MQVKPLCLLPVPIETSIDLGLLDATEVVAQVPVWSAGEHDARRLS